MAGGCIVVVREDNLRDQREESRRIGLCGRQKTCRRYGEYAGYHLSAPWVAARGFKGLRPGHMLKGVTWQLGRAE